MPRPMMSTRRRAERAALVSAQTVRQRASLTPDASLAELAELARTAGAKVVGQITQRLKRATHTYLGKGKIDELREFVADHRVDTVICDDELSPTQQRNIEAALDEKAKVIDRTALILDVFAARARTREGRLQVELAQHEYLLPRLAGQWSHLERLGGGIGTRGPGESQIETDRRLIRGRIQRIRKALHQVSRQRDQYRARRRSVGFPVVSLVGYTNAGKSSLLNALSDAGVEVEDKLFTTLDPVTRKVVLPSGREALFTDTVGFIQKLPPAIIAAFRATLEEIREASLILHVADVSHPHLASHVQEVEDILEGLGAAERPTILALNKIDLLAAASPEILLREYSDSGAVLVSATEHRGFEGLLGEIERRIAESEPASERMAVSKGFARTL